MEQGNRQWHRMTIDAVLQALNTNAACGLTVKAARSRSKKEGANILFSLQKSQDASLHRRLLTDPATWLFLIACLLNLCFLNVARAGTAFLIFICCLPVLLLIHARDKSLQRARSRASGPMVTVVREGATIALQAQSVVRGDIVLLKKGDVVPCDCRIIEEQELRVATLMQDQEGRPVYRALPKSASVVYPKDLAVEAPYCENMLYGGSVVEGGAVLAVAVEIGGSCFAAASEGLDPLQKRNASALQKWEARLKKSTHGYQIALYLAFIPVLLLGVFLSPKGTDLLSVFLSCTTVLLLSSQTLLTVRLLAIGKLGVANALYAKDDRPPILFQTQRAVDGLAAATDLFLLGRASVSDQKNRLVFLATDEGELDLSSNVSLPVGALCEAFLFRMRAEGQAEKEVLDGEEGSVCADLLRLGEFDRESIDVLLLSAKRVFGSEKLSSYAIRTKQEKFVLHFYKTSRAIDLCTANAPNRACLDEKERKRWLLLAQKAEKHAECVEYVLKQSSNGCKLLGIVGASQLPDPSIDQALASLSSVSLDAKIFLFGEPSKELLFGERLKGRREYVRDDKQETPLSPDLLNRYDLFIGFSRREVLELLSRLRANKRRVAAVAPDHASLPLAEASDIAICYDSVVLTAIAGRKSSAPSVNRLSDLARRNADILLPAFGEQNGGPAAVFEALLQARTLILRQSTAFSFLLFSQLFLLAAFIFSIFTGRGLLPAVALLFIEWGVANACVGLLLASKASAKALKKPIFFLPLRLSALLKSKGARVAFLVSLLLLVAVDLVGIFLWSFGTVAHTWLLTAFTCLFYAFSFLVLVRLAGLVFKK